MDEVTIEAIAWVNRFVGGDGTSRVVFREPLQRGDTVRTVLRRLSERFPDLNEALWLRDSDELDEHIQVLVGNSFADPQTTLNTEVLPNETITLLGQFAGG